MHRRISRYQKVQEVAPVQRGDICIVAFDPTVGFEVQKVRPAVVIQNDIGNRHSPLTIVAAITSKLTTETFPVEVAVEPSQKNGLTVRSAIRLDQIRTIDKQRIIKRIGRLDPLAMRRVDEAIKISLGLIDL